MVVGGMNAWNLTHNMVDGRETFGSSQQVL